MRGITVAALVAAIGLALPAAATADWPVYGHDLSNTRNAGGEGPPPTAVSSTTQSWAFHSPTGDFTGTPVVAGGVVVAGDNAGTVYALNAVTGNMLWSKHVGQPITGSAAIDLGAPGGAAVFVPIAQSGSPRVIALSLANGATRWDAVLTNQANSSVFGSPTVWNGTVYIGTSGPNEDTTNARGSVVALNEANGGVRWQTFTVTPGHDGAAVWSTPAVDPATGRLYIGTGNNYHPPTTNTSDAIMALDASTGQILSKFQATPGDSFSGNNNPLGGPDYDFGSSPNLFSEGGHQVVGDGQKSGTYWALDRSTMSPLWHTNVGPGGPLGGLLGSSAIDSARVYGGDTASGQVFALNLSGGTSAWSSLDPGGLHVSPYSVANGVVYDTDQSGFLNARDPATGLILNKFSLGGASFGGVSATGRALYVAVGTGPLLEPLPQNDPTGSIIAFGDTSRSGGSVAGGGGRGRGAAGGATGGTRLPSNRRCIASGVLRFRLRDPDGQIKSVAVLVNGRRRTVLRHRGQRLVTVRLRPGRATLLSIVVTRRDGTRVTTTRRYKDCKRGAARRRVRRQPRHASSRDRDHDGDRD